MARSYWLIYSNRSRVKRFIENTNKKELPITAFAVPTKPEKFEKLENEFSLKCKKYVAESCAAKFISMAAYTYLFAVNQGKHPGEAMDMSDKLFVGIMRCNKIKPEIMFTKNTIFL